MASHFGGAAWLQLNLTWGTTRRRRRQTRQWPASGVPIGRHFAPLRRGAIGSNPVPSGATLAAERPPFQAPPRY